MFEKKERKQIYKNSKPVAYELIKIKECYRMIETLHIQQSYS